MIKNHIQLNKSRWKMLQLRRSTFIEIASGPCVPEIFAAQLKSFPPQINQLIVVFVNTIHITVIL